MGDQVELINQIGLQVRTATIKDRIAELDISNLTPGMYTLLIKKNNEVIFTEKVVKE